MMFSNRLELHWGRLVRFCWIAMRLLDSSGLRADHICVTEAVRFGNDDKSCSMSSLVLNVGPCQ